MAHDLDDLPGTQPRVLASRNLELILAASLVPSADPKLAGFDTAWKERQRRELTEEATRYLAFAEPGLEWATLSLCDYLPITGIFDDWPRFAAFVRARPIEDFLAVLLNHDIPADEIARLLREPAQAAQWTHRLSCFSRMTGEAAVAIFSDPEGFRDRLLAYVEGNRTPAFDERMAGLKPVVAERIRSIREQLQGRDPIAFAETLARKPFNYPREFRTHTFIPCHFIGPKTFFSWGEGHFLLAFSLSQTAERASEQARELSERFKVFGDRTRLEILHLLSQGPSYGKAIADRLEVTTATASRQLDQLKEAGLVTEDRADAANIKLVHLKTEAIKALLDQLQNFLGVPKT